MGIKRLARDGVFTAVALTVFVIELQIPELVPIPGVKLGLSNIVTLAAMFLMGPWDAGGILLCRIILGSIFGGNLMALAYSAAGGAAAYLASLLMRRIVTEKQIWAASVFSALAHSLGQMAAAVLITATPSLAMFLPPMLAISVVTGLLTGLAAQLAVERLEKVLGK